MITTKVELKEKEVSEYYDGPWMFNVYLMKAILKVDL